jgi:integrating conjugative element protein (TIGR03761 family)
MTENTVSKEKTIISSTTNSKISKHHLLVHTRLAENLWLGNKTEKKLGFLQFATALTTLHKAVRNDDPYAEWYLYKTYQHLINAQAELKGMETYAKSLLSQLRGIEVTLWENSEPKRFAMAFTNPLAMMAARYLIADADYIVRLLLTLEELGIIIDGDQLCRKKLKKTIYDVYHLPLKWKKLNVTREDIVKNNQNAKAAANYFGQIPEAILQHKIKYSFLSKTKGMPT